ncbi:MAG TPA: MlaD family protein [Solirubrobacteraceae bacterium]|nr:MlaD family protein [Solirubrobacteraceae bacterium]
MVTQAPRRSAVVAALTFTLSCVGLMIFVWTQFGGSIPFAPEGYQFKVRFQNAADLVAGDDVRISGIDVGKVVAVTNSVGSTLATLQLQRQFAPIASNARAILRLKTLLGEVFVDLSSGSVNAPKLPDGGTLPSTQVVPTQPLDKVLDTLTPTTQRNLDNLLAGVSGGLEGDGASLSAALGNAALTTSQLDQLANLLDAQRGSVQGLVRDTGVVLRSVSIRQSALRQLVTAGQRVFATTAARNRDLTATVNALAPLLPELRTTLDRAYHALALADPTIRTLLPVAPLVAPTLARLTALGPPARALLRQAVPLIASARVALPELARITNSLRALLHVIEPVGRQLAPVVALVHEYTPELVDDMGDLAAAGSASGLSAGGVLRRYYRIQPVFSNQLLFGQPTRGAGVLQNAYHAPNELAQIANGGLLASTCERGGAAALPVLGGAPPCKLQGGWKFEGLVRYFPHVEAAN